MINSWKELKYIWRSDFYRYTGKVNFKLLLHLLWTNPGFKYTVVMRFCSYLAKGRSNFIGRIVYRFFYEILRCYQIKFGLQIPPTSIISSGFYISHYGGIVVNTDAVIGKNCNIGHNVTIGQTNRGEKKGCPVIGDNVFIGPGAVLLGNIKIGNKVAIGANAVVVKDVPDEAVVAGNPAQIISQSGSAGYINRTDY